jgi:hypothetical protein
MKNDSISNDQNLKCLELKYCERCGGLWFRECGSARVYCARCLPEIGELPEPWEWPNANRPATVVIFEDVADFKIEEPDDEDDIDVMTWPTAGGMA